MLRIGGSAFFIILLSFFLFNEKWCYVGTICNTMERYASQNLTILYYLIPLILLFSLLTYKMHEKVFRAWISFAYWWVPLSIVLTLLAGGGSGGGFGMPNVFDREFVAFIFSALFFIISLIIILWKYVATRRGAVA